MNKNVSTFFNIKVKYRQKITFLKHPGTFSTLMKVGSHIFNKPNFIITEKYFENIHVFKLGEKTETVM
jgi:hypothetical protein